MDAIHKAAIKTLLDQHKRISDLDDRIDDIFGSYDGEFTDIIWKLIQEYVNVVEVYVGDELDWISWFIWENSCGKNGLMAGIDGKERNIKTINDLFWLIDGSRRKE